MNASQPCQIQVTTFIFTIVSRDRQKKHIYLQRLCWSLPGWNRRKLKCLLSSSNAPKPWTNSAPLKQQQGLPSALKMWPWRQFETHLHIRHIPVQLQQLLDMWKTTPGFLNLFGDWTKHSQAKTMLQNTSSAAFPQQNFPGWRIQHSSNKHSGFLLRSVGLECLLTPTLCDKICLKGSYKSNLGKTQQHRADLGQQAGAHVLSRKRRI